ncbi:MAG TPA: methyltransferase [bacterium]|nr:methyltransferase [bacterium]
MDQGDQKPSARLRDLLFGYRVSQAIHVAATLGIGDLLTNGPLTSEDLASATGTHACSLYRLLRALASIGVFQEGADRRFALTPLGECWRSDAPESVRPLAIFVGQPEHWHAWDQLLHNVRTGENAFHDAHGVSEWEYRARSPQAGEIFDRAQASQSRRAAGSIINAYDFSQFKCVVDVGGGQGALLAAILAAHPSLRGVLFDQPHVVARAEQTLRAAGVAGRCQVVGGNFFEAIPAGGDAYVLQYVLHDREDEQARAILQVCRHATGQDGKLLVIEREIGPPNEGAGTKFMDLNMMVSPAGCERTRQEWTTLFAEAGFQLVGACPVDDGFRIIEGVPA